MAGHYMKQSLPYLHETLAASYIGQNESVLYNSHFGRYTRQRVYKMLAESRITAIRYMSQSALY